MKKFLKENYIYLTCISTILACFIFGMNSIDKEFKPEKKTIYEDYTEMLNDCEDFAKVYSVREIKVDDSIYIHEITVIDDSGFLRKTRVEFEAKVGDVLFEK